MIDMMLAFNLNHQFSFVVAWARDTSITVSCRFALDLLNKFLLPSPSFGRLRFYKSFI